MHLMQKLVKNTLWNPQWGDILYDEVYNLCSSTFLQNSTTFISFIIYAVNIEKHIMCLKFIKIYDRSKLISTHCGKILKITETKLMSKMHKEKAVEA